MCACHASSNISVARSRLHWALLEKDAVLEIWDTGHLGKASLSEGSGGVIEEGIPLSFISARARHMLRGDGSVIGSVSGTPEVSNTPLKMYQVVIETQHRVLITYVLRTRPKGKI